MISTKDLSELLRILGAQLIEINADGYFTVAAPKQLPIDIEQLSIQRIIESGHGRIDYLYTFHPSAEENFATLLAHELEKKRYQEFSKTFDKQVQSELEQ